VFGKRQEKRELFVHSVRIFILWVILEGRILRKTSSQRGGGVLPKREGAVCAGGESELLRIVRGKYTVDTVLVKGNYFTDEKGCGYNF
jgi:hypothetical protein